MKNRFKSYSFWTALAGAVVVLLNALGDCFGFSVDNDLVKGLIMAVAGVLVVLGIVTMPNNDDSTGQDKVEENKDEETSDDKNEGSDKTSDN